MNKKVLTLCFWVCLAAVPLNVFSMAMATDLKSAALPLASGLICLWGAWSYDARLKALKSEDKK